MRLAATELSIEAEDGADLFRSSENAQGNQLDDILQALCRVGVREELLGVLVLVRGVATENLREVRREIALLQRSLENVRARLADGEKIVSHDYPKCLFP